MNCEGASRVTVLKETYELAIVTRRSTEMSGIWPSQDRQSRPPAKEGKSS